MKNLRMLCMAATMLLNVITSGCSKAQKTSDNSSATTAGIGSLAGKKVLIVYLTRTKNTEAIAKIIQKQVGGQLTGLELVNPYPQNYQAQVEQVVRENESGFLPPLKTKVDSIAAYDVVFVGFPTWDMKMPPPMKSFLK